MAPPYRCHKLVEMREIVGPRQITRENSQRFITVQCNVVDRDIGSFVAEGQAAIDRSVELPPGYLVTWGGQFELQQQANRRLAVVVPVTLLLIFVLLYSAFNSLRSTALILLNIPLALVGGIAALWISGQNLSVPASVGLIALFGIALENAMVLVTTLDQLVRKGVGDRRGFGTRRRAAAPSGAHDGIDHCTWPDSVAAVQRHRQRGAAAARHRRPRRACDIDDSDAARAPGNLPLVC